MSRTHSWLGSLAGHLLGRDVNFVDKAYGLVILAAFLATSATGLLLLFVGDTSNTAAFLVCLQSFSFSVACFSLFLWSAMALATSRGVWRLTGTGGMLLAISALFMSRYYLPVEPAPFSSAGVFASFVISWLILHKGDRLEARTEGRVLPEEYPMPFGFPRRPAGYLTRASLWYVYSFMMLALILTPTVLFGQDRGKPWAEMISLFSTLAIFCVPVAFWITWVMRLEQWRKLVHVGSCGLAFYVALLGLFTFPRPDIPLIAASCIFLAGLLIVLFIKPGGSRSDIGEPPRQGHPGV